MNKEVILSKIEELRKEIVLMDGAAQEDILSVIEEVNRLNDELKSICVREAKFPLEIFEKKWVAQSMQFAMDCMPEIHRILKLHYRRAYDLKLLDVGAGSGAGSNLIAALHADRMIYSKIEVDAIDYIDKRLLWARFQYPQVNYQVQDLYDLPSKQWDLVLCSHCLEHVEEPHNFCEKIIDVCKGFALIYTPNNELERIQDHLTTFTEAFYDRYPVANIEIFNSMAWYADKPENKVMLVTIDCRTT